MDTESGTIRATLPKMDRLETPEGYQKWAREMRTFLIQTGLWKYTTEVEATFPSRVT